MVSDNVLQEFSRWTGHPNPPRPLQTYWYDTDAMAQEIGRLRAILAALREPSKAVLAAANEADGGFLSYGDVTTKVIRAAVMAAEQEGGNEPR